MSDLNLTASEIQANDKFNSELQKRRLSDAAHYIQDLVRMLEAVRYTAGLGERQWRRVQNAKDFSKVIVE